MLSTRLNLKTITPYLQLMRFDRPIGTLLLLWPTLWGLWLAANGMPSWPVLLIFITGVIIMRAAGCVINDITDRHIDGNVSRTKQRPLITGSVSTRQAYCLFGFLSACAFILALMLNTQTQLMAVVGFAITCIYPLLKRITHLPQCLLSVAFSWGIPMAFTATSQHIPAYAWLLMFATALWIIMYDTQYAMVDRADDLIIGVKSTAILFGQYDKLIIALLQISVIGLLAWVGILCHLGTIYIVSLIMSAALFIYQQYLIFNRIPQQCLRAFLNNQWVGLVIFLGFYLHFCSFT